MKVEVRNGTREELDDFARIGKEICAVTEKAPYEMAMPVIVYLFACLIEASVSENDENTLACYKQLEAVNVNVERMMKVIRGNKKIMAAVNKELN